MTKFKKLTLLSSLYLAQGLPYGFFSTALPVFMRDAHLSLPQIGLANLLALPWALKFLWAPQVDRRRFRGFGLRKSWLLPTQFGSIALYALLASLPLKAGDLSLILAGSLFANLFAAAQDIATDATAVDVLTTSERGWANGIQVAGYRAGEIVGGMFLIMMFPFLGWTGVMLALAIISFACTLSVLLYREPADRVVPESKTPFIETVHFYMERGALWWGLVLLLYKFGHAAASTMVRPWLRDAGYSFEAIGGVLGVGAFIAGFLGALCGGWLAVRASRARLLVVLGFVQVCGLACYLWPALTEHSTLKILLATSADNFTSGLATTVLFTVMMDACSRDRSASDYTIQACTVVVSQMAAGVFSGYAAEALGYSTFFIFCAVIGACTLTLTAFVLRHSSVQELIRPVKDAPA